jgi:dienelactone hydrolase
MLKTKQIIIMAAVILSSVSLVSCNNGNASENENNKPVTNENASEPNIKEETVSYTADTITSKGYVAYDEKKQGKRPGILVVHEWWGLNDYPKKRAKQLAEMGYIAIAVDMYGDGKVAANPQEAMAMATPFYKNPELAKTRLDAAIKRLKEYAQTDTGNIAAIGYCYGGYVVLNAAKLGADLKGVVSFHGSLAGVPPHKDLLKAKVLVCHGEADKFESPQEIAAFKKGMDSVGADYTFKTYANATHAFTNPASTETGKKFNMPIEYNAAADTASWNEMKTFFGKIFTAGK